MLKNILFIVNLHIKYRNICVTLYTFTNVVINNTFLSYQLICKFIDSKRFPRYWKPFFIPKYFTLLT